MKSLLNTLPGCVLPRASDVLQHLLGEILLSGRLRVYFIGMRSLFSFILLTYNIMIMLFVAILCVFYYGGLSDGIPG